MPIVESALITGSIQQAVVTGADNDSLVTGNSHRENREQWRRIIDDEFIEWALHPDLFDDDHGSAPDHATIQLAARIATALANLDAPPPTRVVVDANGGIVFEIQCGDVFESVCVGSDLSIEYRHIINGRLVKRDPWRIDDF
jgi:hypothetical protein